MRGYRLIIVRKDGAKVEKKLTNNKKKGRVKDFLKSRTMVQIIATLLTNIHLPNFFEGTLY